MKTEVIDGITLALNKLRRSAIAISYIKTSRLFSTSLISPSSQGQGIEEDRLWSSNQKQTYNHPDHHFVKAATLEDIVVIMTSVRTF